MYFLYILFRQFYLRIRWWKWSFFCTKPKRRRITGQNLLKRPPLHACMHETFLFKNNLIYRLEQTILKNRKIENIFVNFSVVESIFDFYTISFLTANRKFWYARQIADSTRSLSEKYVYVVALLQTFSLEIKNETKATVKNISREQ